MMEVGSKEACPLNEIWIVFNKVCWLRNAKSPEQSTLVGCFDPHESLRGHARQHARLHSECRRLHCMSDAYSTDARAAPTPSMLVTDDRD